MFTLFSADFIGNPGNCSYPHKTVVMDTDSMKAAVSHDYVCAEYKITTATATTSSPLTVFPWTVIMTIQKIRKIGSHRQTCWRHFRE